MRFDGVLIVFRQNGFNFFADLLHSAGETRAKDVGGDLGVAFVVFFSALGNFHDAADDDNHGRAHHHRDERHPRDAAFEEVLKDQVEFVQADASPVLEVRRLRRLARDGCRGGRGEDVVRL